MQARANGPRPPETDAFDPPRAREPEAPAWTESPPPAVQARTASPPELPVHNGTSGPVADPESEARRDDGPATGLGGGAPAAAIFDRFRSRALEQDRARFASLDGTSLVGIEGDTIRIGAPAAFHVERLRQRQSDLEAVARDLFGRSVRVVIELAADPRVEEVSSASREQSRKRRQEALNSESVNLAIEVLDAEIVEIRPLGESP